MTEKEGGLKKGRRGKMSGVLFLELCTGKNKNDIICLFVFMRYYLYPVLDKLEKFK